jgi:hypothetical protein
MKQVFLILSVVLMGCQQADDLFTSYGEEITISRKVSDFTKINAGDKFDILLVQDSLKSGDIEITAGKNVIDGYLTEVTNGELFIKNSNKFNWVRKLQIRQKVVVYFKNLEELQINGSAKFTCKDTIVSKSSIIIKHGGLEDADLNINGDYIFADCTNTGGVNLTGSCFLLSASVDDISFVNSKNLVSDKCYINSFSKDDSYVDATNVMDIKLYGTGNVYYRTGQNASLSIQAKGQGKVINY